MADAAGRASTGASNEQFASIGGRRLRITNLDKVLYPETGTTKAEVIDYYTRIGPTMIPHVTGRPVTRKRWPDGVGTDEHPAQSFFAKDLERGAPGWVHRLPIPHSGGPKDYPLIDDVPTLVYLAQVASLELHVPQWRFTPEGARGDADRLVLDLDPGPGVGLPECAQVARWAREILDQMGLHLFPVTSGSKGMQLYAALPAGQSSEAASAIAHELAQAIEADHPDLVVSSMNKAIRGGRVLIDWSQNNSAKTTIAPYSLRGRAHPDVAAPRTWDELERPDLAQLSFEEVLARVQTIGDPMSELGYRMKTDIDGRVQPGSAPVTASLRADGPADAAAADPPFAWPPTADALRPMLSTRSTPERAKLAVRRWGDPVWAEAKWDGIRAVGVWDGSRLRLVARSGNDLTSTYPDVTDVDVGLGAEPAIVDGEIVAIDDRGRPSFPLLQTRMNLQRPTEIAREATRTPVQYYLFDVLAAHGRDVTGRPLRERRQILEELASAATAPVVVPPVFDDVDGALAASEKFGLEGVVVKDPASPYRRGDRSGTWLKVKLTRTQEVVLAGIRPGRGGRAQTFGSLLLGIPGPGGLEYAGRVGTGFSDVALRTLVRTLEPLHTDQNPLQSVPALDAQGVQWLRPEMVGEVQFGEFTPGGILRHSRWRGLRPDKSPADVARES